jgi:hypothetical protein
MDEKPEAGSPRAAKSSRQGRSKSVRLPPRDSYPLTEIIAAWKDYLDEKRIVEYIKLGKLTCGILLGDRPVKVNSPSLFPGHRGYISITVNGYFTLAAEDAASAYSRRGHRHAATGGRFVEHVTEEGQKIILKSPFYKVGWVSNWLANRHDLRITHEERTRFERKCGMSAVVSGDALASAVVATAPTTMERPDFRKAGKGWIVGYKGSQIPFPDWIGVEYIAFLVSHPGERFAPMDLMIRFGRVKADPDSIPADGSSGDRSSEAHDLAGGEEVVDAEAIAAWQATLEKLEDEVELLRDSGDNSGQAAEKEAEIASIKRELRNVTGPKGRLRTTRDKNAERARIAVTKAILEAIDEIEKHHFSLGQHLRSSVNTGGNCYYAPERTTS